MRILAIADIHGMYDKFIELLEQVKYDPMEDELILLGDYIDRGPEPIKTLQKVMELQSLGAIVLMGNHEGLFIQAYFAAKDSGLVNSNEYYSHLANGGQITWEKFNKESRELQKEIIGFIARMPTIMEIDNYIFVHAGIDFSIGIPEQDRQTLLWARDEFISSLSINPTYQGKIVVFGHTPTWHIGMIDNTIWYGNGKIGIDCGCVFGGKLACLELPSIKKYYV